MDLLLVFYIVTVYLIVNNYAYDTQIVRIRGPNPNGTSYLVDKNKWLKIVFENFTGANYIECTYNNVNLVYSKHEDDALVMSIPQVIHSMGTLWKCKDDNNTTKFSMYIRLEEFVSMTVGPDTIAFDTTTESTTEFDVIQDYICEVGELIVLNCKKDVDGGHMSLRYYNKHGTTVIDTQDFGPNNFNLGFKIQVRDNHFSGSYADCAYIPSSSNRQQQSIYRIVFKVSPKSSYDFIITVNDIKLTAHNNRNMYDYKFIYGDQLTVTCEKSLRNSITSEIQTLIETASEMKNLPINVTDIEKTDSKYRFLIDTKYLDKALLMCYTEAGKLCTSASYVMFNVDLYDDPAVLGLSYSDILYQYNTKNTERIIHYQYMVNQILNLTCLVYSPITGSLRWIYGKSIASTVHVHTYYGYQYINNVFKMDTESYHSITCKTTNLLKHRQIIIILHQKPGLPPNEHDLNVEELQDNRTTPNQNNKDDQLPVVTIVGPLCGILLVVGILVFYWWRKKRNVVATEEKPPRLLTKECNPIHEAADQGEYHDYESVQYDYEQNCTIIRRSKLNNKNRPPAPPPNGSRLPKGDLSPQHVFHERINHKVERPHESPKEKENLIPDRNSSRRDGKNAHIECEYDYVYNRPKKPPRFPVPPSDRGPRKPL